MNEQILGAEEVSELEYAGESALQDLVEKMPWWAISVAFHTVLLAILWQMNFGRALPKDEKPPITIVRLKQIKEHDYIFDSNRDMKRKKVPDVQVKLKDVKTPPLKEVKPTKKPQISDDVLKNIPKGTSNGLMSFNVGREGFLPNVGLGGGSGGLGPWGRPDGNGSKVPTGGSTKATEGAVLAGLKWLARHQSKDGGWHPDTWSDNCPSDDCCVGQGGGAVNDRGKDRPAAITGFALLAYLGSGHTHLRGSFKETVKRSLGYLEKAQKPNGKFTPGDMYDHGIASLAVVEAYGMSHSKRLKSERLRSMAQKAVDYIVKTQNPLGGWNYRSPSDRNDMSVSAWQIMALKSAIVSGLDVPQETRNRVLRWLDIATNDSTGQVYYSVKGNDPNGPVKHGGGSIRMRAAGALCHLFFGKDRRDPVLRKMGDVFLTQVPVWPVGEHPAKVQGVDLYYWYYASLVNIQMGGKYWKKWNIAMKNALVETQVTGKRHADGSWPPVDQYSKSWSRPGTTALCVLTLEVYYRYPLMAK